MQSISARVSDETYEDLQALAEERGTSVSDVVRELIQKGQDHDDLEAEVDRLQRELAATNRRVDEHQELVAYVEDERQMQRRREDRERMKETAGVLTRAKWWVTGMPDPESDDG